MPAPRLLYPRAGHSQKVSSLTGDEYRVWTQYLLSADDFGVMRCSAPTLQADNDALEALPKKEVERLLQRVIDAGLVRTFEHQGKSYAYQPDWQDWQKVGWPTKTILPKPPADALTTCSDLTQFLFLHHPGGTKVPKRSAKGHAETNSGSSSDRSESSGSSSEVPQHPRAGVRASTLTANANASASEGGPGETDFPLDVLFAQFRDAYPERQRADGPIAQQAFMAIFDRDTRPRLVVFQELLDAVKNHRDGDKWARGYVPGMVRWLREGYYTQRHDPAGTAPKPVTAAVTTAAKARMDELLAAPPTRRPA